MKKLVLIMQDIGTMIRREKAGVTIILLSLGLSVCVSLTLVSFYSSYIEIFQRMRIDKSSYKISYGSYSAQDSQLTPIEAFDGFFLKENSPPVIDSFYALSFSVYPSVDEVITYGPAAGQTEPDIPMVQHISWRPYFSDDRLAPLLERESEKILLEGRLFTADELQEGAAVAVVGRDSFPDVKLGDKIKILDRDISVIGIRKEHNAIPYRLMQKMTDREKGFYPDTFICIFEEPLSEEQLGWLERAGFSLFCYFDVRKAGYYTEIMMSLGIITGALLLTVLNSLNMFQHLIQKDRYRVMVMKVCGAGKGTVFGTLYLVPLLVCGVSGGAGILLYRLLLEPIIVREFQLPQLSGVELLIVLGVVLLLSFLMLLPTVRRMVKAQPAEAAMWR